jgi:hypothetical protein
MHAMLTTLAALSLGPIHASLKLVAFVCVVELALGVIVNQNWLLLVISFIYQPTTWEGVCT